MTLIKSLFPEIEFFLSRMNDNFLEDDKYPPKNIYVQELPDKSKKLVFEIALSGHKKDDINVVINNDCLIIETTGNKTESDDQIVRQYFKHNLAKRKFRLQYTISRSYFDLDNPIASFEDGILKIEFNQAKDSIVKKLTF